MVGSAQGSVASPVFRLKFRAETAQVDIAIFFDLFCIESLDWMEKLAPSLCRWACFKRDVYTTRTRKYAT